MEIIPGAPKPRSRDVYLGEERVTAFSTSERIERGLASRPAVRRVFPSMSVGANLQMGAYRRGDRGVFVALDRAYRVLSQ